MENYTTAIMKNSRCIVTWFTWILTSRSQYLTWCDRYVITPESKDGTIGESASFDENSIKIIDDGVTDFFVKKQEPIVKTWWPEVYVSRNWY